MKKIKYLSLVLPLVLLSIFFIAKADTDTTNPSAITNLSASNITQTSVLLSWTAPGDDGGVGTSTTYALRYSTSAITDLTWASSTDATGEPTPKVSGSAESMSVSGLASSTTYYFAIKSSDEAGNWSALSNVVSFTTLAPVVPTPTPSATTFEMKVTPRTLNLDSHGNWVTVQLYIPAPYKAHDIDISSLLLNGSLKPDSNFKGIDKFSQGRQDKGKSSSNLLLKFSRQGIQSLVGNISAPVGTSTATSTSGRMSGAAFVLTLTGKVSGTNFTASDTINIFKKIQIEDGEDDEDEGDLIQSTSSPEVYIIEHGKKRHIPSVQAFERLRLRWENIVKVTQQIIDAFADDELLRAEGSPEVYIIFNGMKRHIRNPEVFNSYGFDWGDISVVSKADIADYPDAMLIRAAGDSKVFLLLGGQKHWVASLSVFNKKGYDWNKVIIVNSTEADSIPTGSDVQ